MKILIDIDNTLCDNMGAWLGIYNAYANDIVRQSDIKDWNIEQYLKPEYVEFFWEKALTQSYKVSKPFPNAKMVINDLLVCHHEITYVTAGVCVEKMNWMYEWGFTEGKHPLAPKNIIIAYKKDWIYGDLLIDDGLHNVISRRSILFDQPWNQGDVQCPRAKNWEDVEDIILGVFP